MDINTQEAFETIRANYANGDENFRLQIREGLQQDYGPDYGARFVKAIEDSNYEAYVDLLSQVESNTFQEGALNTIQEGFNNDPTSSPAGAVGDEEAKGTYDIVKETVENLQGMEPVAAQELITKVAGEDQNFSQGLIKMYCNNSKDFSSNLAYAVTAWYNKRCMDIVNNPSDFSESEIAEAVRCTRGQLTSRELLKTMSDFAEMMPDETVDGNSVLQGAVAETEQIEDAALLERIEDIYDNLPSQDAKDAFMEYLCAPEADPNMAPIPQDYAEGEASDEGQMEQVSDEVLAAQLSEDEKIIALAEKFSSLDDQGKQAMYQMMVENLGEQMANFVVDKATGKQFSEEQGPTSVSEAVNPAGVPADSTGGMESLDSIMSDNFLDGNIIDERESNTFQEGEIGVEPTKDTLQVATPPDYVAETISIPPQQMMAPGAIPDEGTPAQEDAEFQEMIEG